MDDGTMETAALRIGCKVNLTLRITGVRPNGWHELDTVFLVRPILLAVQGNGFVSRGHNIPFKCPLDMSGFKGVVVLKVRKAFWRKKSRQRQRRAGCVGQIALSGGSVSNGVGVVDHHSFSIKVKQVAPAIFRK